MFAGVMLVAGSVWLQVLDAPDAQAGHKKARSASVAGAAFTDDLGDEDCRVIKGPFATYREDAEASDEDCDLVAGIQLPDAASLTAMTCSFIDSHPENALEGYLQRVDLATGESETVFATAGTTVDSGSIQSVADNAPEPGTGVVDNGRYAYYVAAAFSGTDFTNVGTLMRVYGCTVSYE